MGHDTLRNINRCVRHQSILLLSRFQRGEGEEGATIIKLPLTQVNHVIMTTQGVKQTPVYGCYPPPPPPPRAFHALFPWKASLQICLSSLCRADLAGNGWISQRGWNCFLNKKKILSRQTRVKTRDAVQTRLVFCFRLFFCLLATCSC